MRESFPRKKAGDALSARLANKWSDAARRVSQMYPFSGSLDPQLIRFGELTGSLSQGGSAEVRIWHGAPLEASNEYIDEVYDWFLGSGDSLASGTRVKVEWYCDRWYVTAAEC